MDAKEIKAEYLREWRRKNKEKVAQYNRNYWEKKAQERNKATESGKAPA